MTRNGKKLNNTIRKVSAMLKLNDKAIITDKSRYLNTYVSLYYAYDEL